MRLQANRDTPLLRRYAQHAVTGAARRHTVRTPRMRFVPGLAAALLAGCELLGAGPAPLCPHVAVVSDAESLVVFNPGPGRELSDVSFAAEFSGLTRRCSYGEAALDVELEVTVEAQPGPLARIDRASIPLFVAVVDFEGTILGKRVFTRDVRFRGRGPVTYTEDLEQTIALRPGQGGGDFEILLGFQLSPEQLEQSRAARARR